MTIDKERLKALAESLIVANDQLNECGKGNEFDDAWSVANDYYVEATDPEVILGLLAEIERLEMDNRSLKGSCSKLGAEHAGMSRLYKKANRMQFEARQERDQLKADNEALRKALGDLLALYEDDEGCRSLPEYIAGRAAMAKEAPHG